MNELNKEQDQAAGFLNGIALIIAVPGSGKTLTMTHRIGNLVLQGIPPENILGLTFTRNAAEDMRKRLGPVLGEQSHRVTLSTIHSFCHFLLRSEGRTFEILSGKDQLIFLKGVMKKLRMKDLSVGTVLREISLAKNNIISPEEFRDLYEGDKTMVQIADIYQGYDREKVKKMLMDFDDLLLETLRLLREDTPVREKYQGMFKHLLVDEFQDTNPVQMEILKILINGQDNGSSFWCAGDDWQSIYSFTGASVGNILRFHDVFPGSERFILNLNYRSTPQILRACQNLIRHNERKIDKTLVTRNIDGEDVVVLENASEEQEALSLVNEIRELVEQRGYAHKDIAVLYRANFQSRPLEEIFSQHKVPYHIQNGMNFYERREVRVMLDYLRLIRDPYSEQGDEALLSVINIPNRYLGRKFVQELESFANRKRLNLYAALREMPVELTYLRKNVREFVDDMDLLMSQCLEPAEAIHILRSTLDYDRWVTDEDIPSPDDQKIRNLDQLQMSAARYDDIREFLEYTETFQDQAISDNKEGVALMTIHKAKGLEFPVVFVVGLIEGILPSKKGDLEEERRICFVGISRAMKLLYLSHTTSYLNAASKRSVFLDEILGQEDMEHGEEIAAQTSKMASSA